MKRKPVTWQDRPQVKVAFARALRTLRHAALLSDWQLADKCNIDYCSPSLLELAKRSVTITMFLILADGLEVSAQTLLTRTLDELQKIRITGDLTIEKDPSGQWPAHRRNGKHPSLKVRRMRVTAQDRPKIKVAFGRVLRRLRKKAGLTQVGLALQCAVDSTYVSLLELAIRSPSILMFCALADGLEVSPVDLLTDMLAEL
jgi:transcriptional regulator with XRE-family HTH domain